MSKTKKQIIIIENSFRFIHEKTHTENIYIFFKLNKHNSQDLATGITMYIN